MELPEISEYDKTIAMFSPDGRIFQVEYSKSAVRRGAPAVGVRAADGVVLAGVKRKHEKLLDDYEKVLMVDEHIGIVGAGYMSDSRVLTDLARQVAQRYRMTYGEGAKPSYVARRLSLTMQQYTQFGGVRPFGCSLIIGGVADDGEAEVVVLDTSGAAIGYMAAVIGENEQKAMEVLEKEYRRNVTVAEGVKLALKALRAAVDKLSQDQVEVAVIMKEDKKLRKLTASEIEEAWRST
ncbi:MAG: archaeal proteasome endopeptidase complex subunit alpha [Candidatus Jordarchaeales archaeon]|nr:archaeal proteasome endopeptidase complex subunit alpha [Candidatus Jordarchaeia archaeon]